MWENYEGDSNMFFCVHLLCLFSLWNSPPLIRALFIDTHWNPTPCNSLLLYNLYWGRTLQRKVLHLTQVNICLARDYVLYLHLQMHTYESYCACYAVDLRDFMIFYFNYIQIFCISIFSKVNKEKNGILGVCLYLILIDTLF